LKIFLKKCEFINNIIIDLDINSEEIIELIIKNCNNLKSITFNFNKINGKVWPQIWTKITPNSIRLLWK
jgi:hypothetical protein